MTCGVCGTAGICSAGTCIIDPASRWNVFVETVTVPTTDTFGSAWDAFGGAPDPLVEVRVGSETATAHRTGAGSDVFTVTFTATPVVTDVRADTLKTFLRFDVWDEDATSNDWVGACVYTGAAALVDSQFDGTSQLLTCPADSATGAAGFTLRWHLERR